MMASWSAAIVLSTSRMRGERLPPRLAMKADWSSSAACPFQRVRGEDLVPVVADSTSGPAVPAATCQAHRVGVCRCEERLGCWGAPVDQEPPPRAVGEAEPSDVGGLRAVRVDHAAEAKVQAVATQQAQASGQPVNLQVPVQRLPARAAGGLALGVEAFGQVGDLLLEAHRDCCQVLLIPSNQRRVGLGDQMLGNLNAVVARGITSSSPISI
jgi:hypothetical protein